MWGDMGRYGEIWGEMGSIRLRTWSSVCWTPSCTRVHPYLRAGDMGEIWGGMGRYGEIWGDVGEITRTYVLRAANLRGRTDDLVQCNVFRAPRGYEGGESSDYSGVRSTDVLRF